MSVLATAIYFLTSHISEVQYNNWGTGVWNDLLKISGTGNCSDSSNKNDEYYKACIKSDINHYDLDNYWNSSYWKTWYEGKLANSTDKEKFSKLGSWEKFRELCTKGIDELIKKQEWNKLSNAVGSSSSQWNYIQENKENNNISYEHCWKAK